MKMSIKTMMCLWLLICGCLWVEARPKFVDRILQMQAPRFPDHSIDIRKTGARQGRKATEAIQKAIDRVHVRGGGSVIIPPGHWLTGRLILKSHVNLHVSEGAVLEFTGEIKDYLPAVKTRCEGADIESLGAMIYAYGQEDIAVTGRGTLLAPDYDCEISRHQDQGVTVESEARMARSCVFDGSDGVVYMPTFIGPVDCRNVLIEGVTLQRSIFWNIAPVYCQGIIIRGVTVNSFGHGRTDGIDMDSSSDALIENTTLDCGDDCFTLKAGRGVEATRQARATENVVIRNCHVKRGVGGVTIGSETAGMIRNVYVDSVTMDNPLHAVYIKTRRPRGGGCDSIWINHLTVAATRSAAVCVDMLGSRKWVGELGDRLPVRERNELTPRFSNIWIDGLMVGRCQTLVSVKGLPESPVENLIIRNVKSTDKNVKMHDVGKYELNFAQ